MPPPLACPVRGCGLPLTLHARAYRCDAGHNHDVARTGYVNLLQPQDRRAPAPGDGREAVAARLTLEEAGVGEALIRALIASVGPALVRRAAGATMVDIGCGTGRALATIAGEGAGQGDVTAVGIDLSVAAVSVAARHWPRHTWVVANADRTLPLLDASVDVLLSLHARRNPAEAARVLGPGGVLVVAVPAPDDLAELRSLVQGAATTRDRVESLVAEHAPWFRLHARQRVSDRRRLGRESLGALLRATYRGARAAQAGRVEAVHEMTVTLASDVCLFTAGRADRSAAGPPRDGGRQ